MVKLIGFKLSKTNFCTLWLRPHLYYTWSHLNLRLFMFMSQYVLPTIYLVGYRYGFSYLLSLLAVTFGINTIISKNPVFSVLYLIALFGTVSVYLILSGADFIGLSYLLIYIGAISILFIIILMLINIRISELFQENNNNVLLAILTLLCFNYLTSYELPSSSNLGDNIKEIIVYLVYVYSIAVSFIMEPNNVALSMIGGNIIYVASVFFRAWDTILVTSSHIISIGNVLYTNYHTSFILLAFILLLSMVGAILVTVNKSNKKSFETNLYNSTNNTDNFITSNVFSNL